MSFKSIKIEIKISQQKMSHNKNLIMGIDISRLLTTIPTLAQAIAILQVVAARFPPDVKLKIGEF